jgi:hypothetical protein
VRALAEKRNLFAVRRPRRVLVVRLPAGQHRVLSGRDVEHCDVIVEATEVTLLVLLEVIAVDDDGRRRLALPPFLLLGFLVRVLVTDDEGDARAVGRPLELGNAALDLAHLAGLAATSIEQPDLRPLLLLLGPRDATNASTSHRGSTAETTPSGDEVSCRRALPSHSRSRRRRSACPLDVVGGHRRLPTRPRANARVGNRDQPG